MSADNYDVLPLPVRLGNIKDREDNLLMPFVSVYFPVELMEKMKWTKETRLTLSVEKDFL